MKKVTNSKKAAPKNKKIKNTYADVAGFDPTGFSTQLSQAATLFKNERWYLVSNMRQLLSEMYVEHGLIQTLIDVPVDDAFRGGVQIKSEQLGEDDTKTVENKIDREDDLGVMAQAAKWNRLFGGGAVIILTDQDPATPLNKQALEGAKLEFRAVDMWELFFDLQNMEGFNPAVQTEMEYYNYYGVRLHKSRVMRLKGLTPPSFIRPRLRGWGFSIVEGIVRSLNQFLKNQNLCFEVLDEFKLDIYKIKNLSQALLSGDGVERIKRRVELANVQKNYQHALTMDSEDDYIQKQLSFGGIAEIMREIRMQIACDMRMPITKIFGVSAAGFSSGEDDIENYNSMIESQVRTKIKYDILGMIELRCYQLFGYAPDDIEIEFEPLRVLSSEQEESVKTQKFQRLLQAKQAGEISNEEFRDACNRDNLLGIKLDDEFTPPAQDQANGPGGEGGANKLDSKQVVTTKSSTQAPDAPAAKE